LLLIGLGGGIIAALLVQTPAEWVHVVMYGVLGFAFERSVEGRLGWVIGMAAGSAVGVLDEVGQSLLPNRFADPLDIMLDFLGCTIGVALSSVCRTPTGSRTEKALS